MTTYKERSIWARNYFQTTFGEKFQIKLVSVNDGDFGDLEGFQFDSDHFGGFLHFWSSEMVEWHLVNYETGVEILPISVKDIVLNESTEKILKPLLNALPR